MVSLAPEALITPCIKCPTYSRVTKQCKGQERCRYGGGPEHKTGEECAAKSQIANRHCVTCRRRCMFMDGKYSAFAKEKDWANLAWRNQLSWFLEPASTCEEALSRQPELPRTISQGPRHATRESLRPPARPKAKGLNRR